MDLTCGISGDMFISALADAGVDFGRLEYLFQQAGIAASIEIAPEKRGGITGKLARISWEKSQPLRTLENILPVIEGLDVSGDVKQCSVRAFRRLAEVEGKVHGTDEAKVHFHEMGAVDTLVDIVGAFWGLEVLEINEVTCTPIPWFSGEVKIDHGTIPLPAPATAMLMKGKPICHSEYKWEVVTPTGALIVDQAVSRFDSGFQGNLVALGLGFGTLDRGFNGLRIFLWEDEPEGEYLHDKVWLLESNIDHLTGEELGLFFQSIIKAGALDVIYLQGIMKKNRPGGQIQVMCNDENLVKVRHEFFKQTLTLGMRISRVSRDILPRKDSSLFLEGEKVRAKKLCFCNKTYVRPEIDSLSRLSRKRGCSVVETRYQKDQV